MLLSNRHIAYTVFVVYMHTVFAFRQKRFIFQNVYDRTCTAYADLDGDWEVRPPPLPGKLKFILKNHIVHVMITEKFWIRACTIHFGI